VRASLLLFDRSPPSLILPLFFPTRHGFKDRVPEDDQMRIGEKKGKKGKKEEEEEEEEENEGEVGEVSGEKKKRRKNGDARRIARAGTVMPARDGIYKLQERDITGSLAAARCLNSRLVRNLIREMSRRRRVGVYRMLV
jgi:hypothetical protein